LVFSFVKGFRFFAIVLSKLLLFGEDVERDLYNWRSDSIVQSLSCEWPVYKDLIELCWNDSASTPLVAAIIRSICVDKFQDPQNIPDEPEDNSGALILDLFSYDQLGIRRKEALGKMATSRNIATSYSGMIIWLMKKNVEQQSSFIAALSLVEPSFLLKNALIFQQTDQNAR
jgi:hypothetical protein